MIIIGIINTQDYFSYITTLKNFAIMGAPFLIEEYLFFKNFYSVLKNDSTGFLRVFKTVLSAMLIISVIFQIVITAGIIRINSNGNAFFAIAVSFFISEWPLAIISLIISLIIGKKTKPIEE